MKTTCTSFDKNADITRHILIKLERVFFKAVVRKPLVVNLGLVLVVLDLVICFHQVFGL